MNDELEILIMNSIDDIYKLNSLKIGKKLLIFDNEVVKKKKNDKEL